MRLLLSLTFLSLLASAEPTLFRNPTVNSTHIVFEYAGDLWSVSRAGGQATRLTSGAGVERQYLIIFGWYAEELFARFAVLDVDGTLAGRTCS